MKRITLLVLLALAVGAGVALIHRRPAAAQVDSVRHRWVGTREGRPLTIEFYGDSMLVVNDRYGLDVRVTPDSIIAIGDTTLVVRYRIVLGHLILEAEDGTVITMSDQSTLGRPLTGRWVGDLGTEPPRPAELVLLSDGTARWRQLDAVRWMTGEWERQTRLVTFLWADTTEWSGQYDPMGNAILFERTLPESGASIFRRLFR